MKTAILVIDMLNEYLSPKGKIYCEHCKTIIKPIEELLDFAKKKNQSVIYVNTSLEPGKEVPLIKKWGVHAEKDSWGAQVIDELKPDSTSYIVEKSSFDGFYESTLSSVLNELGIERVVLTGIHTHVCVLITGVEAFIRGYDVIAIEDCITTGYIPNHESRLRFYNTHIGKLLSLQDFKKLENHE